MFTSFNPQEATKTITNFIKQEIDKVSGFSKVILGLSGGIDSAVSVYLATKAIGNENVMVVLLPYKNLYSENLLDAKLIIQQLDIPSQNVFEINIGPLCDSFFRLDNLMNQNRQGSIMARVRMILLFDLAKKHQALVCGTENKSEHLLGYFTRYGDSASDIEPIRHLYKTEVRMLAQYLRVPEKIITKIPTAGFWPGQTDEGQLGFTYQEADQILYLLFEKKSTVSQIVEKGLAKKLVEKIANLVKRNSFMRKPCRGLESA